MPAHLACRVLEVALSILFSTDIALQEQAAFRKELPKFVWFDPERQLLANLRQRGEKPLRPDEGAWLREHIAVNIREEQQTTGRRVRAPPQGGSDSGFGQVVRDAFPENERARRLMVAIFPGLKLGKLHLIGC